MECLPPWDRGSSTQKVDEFLNLLMGGMSYQQQTDFGADPDHNPDAGIFNGMFTAVGWGSCKNFAGSAALPEVCGSECSWFLLC